MGNGVQTADIDFFEKFIPMELGYRTIRMLCVCVCCVDEVDDIVWADQN